MKILRRITYEFVNEYPDENAKTWYTFRTEVPTAKDILEIEQEQNEFFLGNEGFPPELNPKEIFIEVRYKDRVVYGSTH